MNRILLCLAAATVLLLTGCPREPKSKEIVEFERTWLKDYVEQNHRRVNGVLLDATAELKADDVLIHWSLDYDGPRPPLTILKPMCPDLHVIPAGTLELPYYPDLNSAAEIWVIVPDPNRVQRVPVWWIKPGVVHTATSALRDAYITVERGRRATGLITLPLQRIQKALIAELARSRADQLPGEFYVELIHAPKWRGAEYRLDAWTIDPVTEEAPHAVPQRVVVKQWPEAQP